MKIIRLLFIALLFSFSVPAQQVERMMVKNIASVQLSVYGNQQGFPVYRLNSGDKLFLSFDDLEANVKNYYYTYVWCDYNWNPVNITPFEYLKGFTQNRINTYRYSSMALTNYTHYQLVLPEQGMVPVKSGNYLLKVYLDGDTSQMVFTKQMVVVDPKVSVNAAVVQPFTPQQFNTHQKLRFSAQIGGVNSFSAAQQVKVVILQNNRWDIAQKDIPPTFVRGTTLEYNSENIAIFPGGKEWRWLDLRSLRLQSDRIEKGVYEKKSTELFMRTDVDRSAQKYVFFSDLNGMYQITTYESINPMWQGDYATVHFRFSFPDGKFVKDRNLYLAGQFTGFKLNDQWKMKYNDTTGEYEAKAFLKQGYYNYKYILTDLNGKQAEDLEGNYWETENMYTILFYYRAFADRNDQLIGAIEIDSRTDRPGFSF